MFRINPDKTSREAKNVPNSVRASNRTKPIIVSQPHVFTKKDECLISVNHDVCLHNYVNGKKSRGKKQGKSFCQRKPKEISAAGYEAKEGCSKHMTRNLKLLINFVWKFMGTVRFENDHVAAILGFGDLQWGNILITRVYFVEGLGHNLFSVGQLCDSDLEDVNELNSNAMVDGNTFVNPFSNPSTSAAEPSSSKKMDFETAQTSTTAKLPIFKQGEYDIWRLRIEKHFQVQDYALWDVIENENSFKLAAQTTTNLDGSLTTLIPGHVTREKAQKKNDVKARNLNLNFLRSLPSEWHTHVMVWRNKPDLDTMSFDDLYNNFKIVKQEVKGTASSSLSLSSQNMDFLSSPSSTNKVNTDYGVSTANTHVSPASTQVSTASTQVSTANLGDATIYAFLASQPNGSQLVHKDLEQIHEDDLEEMHLKWHLALLSMRTEGGTRNQDSRNKNQDSSRRTVNVEETSSKAMVAIDGASFDWSYMADEEIPKTWLLWLFQTLRPVNTAHPKTTVYNARPMSHFLKSAQSTVKRPYEKRIAFTNKNFSQKVNTAKVKFNTARPKAVNTTRPNSTVVNAIRLNQMLKIHDREHVISSDFKEFNGGYVTFGERAKGGKITSKGTLKTGKLDFEDVYFVKKLQFNLFSVSQMCDKKNCVLFTDTRFFVLSPDFKLADKSQVLLKVPRKNNMYNVDMKNIVPKESLTCLVAKATSMLWPMRLGHAKEVNTACYVQNRVLVVKPHNVTPYELFRGKFDGKSDEVFFVRYSMNSKAFRVYNIRTRKVEENFHIRFLEDKPIIVGDGPKWLFDIDVLTKSMNYVLVVVGVSKESGINDQEKPEISTHNVNTVRPSINTAITNFSTGSLNISTDSPTVPTAPLEATHADFLGDETKVDMSNITTTYQVPTTPNT
nr:ribonuclease H-like domain-containing protein [Tanacetum cinerariifolium]